MGFLFLRWHHEPTHEAVFVAAAMVATSVGITARVLRDLHVHKSRTAQIILGAAVFDDILGMLLLGILVSTVQRRDGVQWLHLGLVAAEAIGFAVFMIFVAPKVVNRLEPGIQQMQTQDAPLVLALALCLGLSVAASSHRHGGHHRRLLRRAGLCGLFAALEPGTARAGHQSVPGAVLLLHHGIAPGPLGLFPLGRPAGVLLWRCWPSSPKSSVAALPLYREGWRSMLQVGVGMTPRGEVALIVALIGLQMNMISQRAYALVIVMTAVTTMLPPPFLKMLFAPGKTAPAPLPPARSPHEVQISGQLG